jgi:putative flippase GtrA
VNQVLKLNRQNFLEHSLGYLLAGLASFAVEYTLFLALYYHFGLPAWGANAVAYTVGLSINFMLNRKSVFKALGSGHRGLGSQMMLYVLLAGANLIITSVLINVLVTWMMAAIAKLLVMAIIVPWNFFLYKYVIFSPRKEQ